MCTVFVPLLWRQKRRSAQALRAVKLRTQDPGHMAFIGMLASGLAHEIKNPLSTMNLHLSLMLEDWEGKEGDGEAERMIRRLRCLRREINRLDGIVRDFLRYAGKHEIQLGAVDLRELVEEIVEFLSAQAKQSNIEIEMETADVPCVASVDYNLIKQALLNVLINANQAMEGGGRLSISVGLDGDTVRMVFVDSGPGMTDEQVERAFEAFYSTKADGTGLGLPTTKRIVEEHGGRIEIESKRGQGTRVVISLPRSSDAPSRSRSSRWIDVAPPTVSPSEGRKL